MDALTLLFHGPAIMYFHSSFKDSNIFHQKMISCLNPGEVVRNAGLLIALWSQSLWKAVFLPSLQQWGFPWTCTCAKWRNWLSKDFRIRLSKQTELELAQRLFLHCSWNLGCWKDSNTTYSVQWNTPRSQHNASWTEVVLSSFYL